LRRCVEQGKLISVGIEGLPNQTFFLQEGDLPTLEKVSRGRQPKAKAAFISPLDNLMWDRKTIGKLFEFDYVWEVYKPIVQRKYGYYVLPVVYGDQFVARVDPKLDRKTGILRIENWWWEEGVRPNEVMIIALSECLIEFGKYLDAKKIGLGDKVAKSKDLQWVETLPDK
jgi:hypothetical protein